MNGATSLSVPIISGVPQGSFLGPHIYKCKNIFTKMLKDVGIEVPKSIETRSKYTMHADKGRG